MAPVVYRHLKDHALAVVVDYLKAVPGGIHPLGDLLFVILRIKLLLSPEHLKVERV